MKKTKQKRTFRFRYLLLTILVLAIAVFLNYEVLTMDNVICDTAGGGACSSVLTSDLLELLAYLTIILFFLLVLNYYVYHEKKQKFNIETTDVAQALSRIDYECVHEEVKEPVEEPIEEPVEETVEEPVVEEEPTEEPVEEEQIEESTEEQIVETTEEQVVEEPLPTPVIIPVVTPVKKEKKETIVIKRKRDVVARVMTETTLSNYKAKKVVNIIFDEISDTLIRGEKVNIESFGVFSKYKVNEHNGINPGTGEKVIVEAHNRVRFVPNKDFKELVSDVCVPKGKVQGITAKPAQKEEEPVVVEPIPIIEEEPLVEPTPVIEKIVKPAKVKPIVKRKSDVIERVMEDTKLSNYKAKKVVNAIFKEICHTIVTGEKVNIDEFGVFSKYRVNEHNGINPGTGEKIIIDAHNRVRFVPSKELKDSVKDKEDDSSNTETEEPRKSVIL